MPELNLDGHHLAQQAEAAAALRAVHEHIEGLNSKLLPYFGGDKNMYATDFLVFAAAKRTLSVGRAFLTMIAVPNFGVAAALLRMQLDTALRFFAMSLVKSPSDYATEILRDARVDKLQSRNGHRLTDRYLLSRLAPSAPWITGVYAATSGFIHLSGRHMFQTFAHVDDADRTVQFVVGAEDVPRSADQYVEIVSAFDAATRLVSSLLFSWLETQKDRR